MYSIGNNYKPFELTCEDRALLLCVVSIVHIVAAIAISMLIVIQIPDTSNALNYILPIQSYKDCLFLPIGDLTHLIGRGVAGDARLIKSSNVK